MRLYYLIFVIPILSLSPLSPPLAGTPSHVNLFPTLGLVAQVPSRRWGITFNPEFRSRLPSSITRAKPRRDVRSAVLGATASRQLGPGPVEVSPGRSADLVRTPQLLPRTPLGGNPCEYFSGGLAVQPWVEARASNRANFSREQFVGCGGETGK